MDVASFGLTEADGTARRVKHVLHEAADYERVEADAEHHWHSLDLFLTDDDQFVVSVRYCEKDVPSCVAEGPDWPALDKTLGLFDPTIDLPASAVDSLKRQVRILFYRHLVLLREVFAKHFPEKLGPE